MVNTKTQTSRIPSTSHHIYAEFTGKLNNTAEVESPTWPEILLSNFEVDKVLMNYISITKLQTENNKK